MQQNCDHLQQVLGQTSSIIVNPDCSINFMAEEAERIISKYFSIPLNGKNDLPAIIHNWLQKNISNLSISTGSLAPTEPLQIIKDNQILMVRLSIDSFQEQFLLILEEKSPLNLSFSALENIGLSKREAELLYWIIRDHSNQQISEILSLSIRTVQKHCENIYSKLGVNNRAAAITQTLNKIGLDIFN